MFQYIQTVITPINDIPKPDGGSPCPVFLCVDDGPLWVAYHILDTRQIAILKFNYLYEYRTGYPNDEGAHPLTGKMGLSHVDNSPRIKQIICEQSNNKRKSSDWSALLQHWIFCFKETTMEAIGEELEVVENGVVSRTPAEAIFNAFKKWSIDRLL